MAAVEEIFAEQKAGYNRDGPTASRVFIVSGITPGTNLLETIMTVSVPQYGELHPSTGGSPAVILDIYALEISADWADEDNTTAKVTVNYSRPSYDNSEPSEEIAMAICQVGSTVASSKTSKDAAGTSIVVSLAGQEDQLAELDVEIPNSVITFQRREANSPFAKSIAYTGKINSDSLGNGVFAAGTLQCLGIEGDSQDNGATWSTTYRFQYRAEGWNGQLVIYTDPDTDRPHKDVDLSIAATGWVEVDLYEEVDFTPLNLNW